MHIYAVGIVSVQVSGKAKDYPYHAAKVYVARKAKAGHWYWDIEGTTGPKRRGSKIVERDAEELAKRFKTEVDNIRWGTLVDGRYLSGKPCNR